MKFFKNKLAVTVIVLSAGFLFLIGYSVSRETPSLVQNAVGVTINPVQSVIYSINNKVKNSIGFIFSFSEVKKENEELRKRNTELESKASAYDAVKDQNERLKAMENFKEQKSQYEYIGCDIIGKSGGNFLEGFVINKGVKDGVSKQMIVITAEGLVGQVTSCENNWSVVQSLANENIAVSGLVESTRENNGIVKGYKDTNNKFLAKIYYLPVDSAIKNGDVILTSGLGGFYPKDIRIGEVIDVEEDKGKVMKSAVIRPYVDLNKLEEVFVVVPKDKTQIKY